METNNLISETGRSYYVLQCSGYLLLQKIKGHSDVLVEDHAMKAFNIILKLVGVCFLLTFHNEDTICYWHH